MRRIAALTLACLLLLTGCASQTEETPYEVIWNVSDGQTQTFSGENADAVWKTLSELPMMVIDTVALDNTLVTISHDGEQYYISDSAPVKVAAKKENGSFALELTEEQSQQLYNCVQAMADTVYFVTAVGQEEPELRAVPKTECAELVELLYAQTVAGQAGQQNDTDIREIHMGLDTFYVDQRLNGTVLAKYFGSQDLSKLRLSPEQQKIYLSFVQ